MTINELEQIWDRQRFSDWVEAIGLTETDIETFLSWQEWERESEKAGEAA